MEGSIIVEEGRETWRKHYSCGREGVLVGATELRDGGSLEGSIRAN